jgi:hypothetical protein
MKYKVMYDCILYILYLYYNFQIQLSLTNMESWHVEVTFDEQEVLGFFGNNSVQFCTKVPKFREPAASVVGTWLC